MTVVVILVLGCWFAISVLCQTSLPIVRKIRDRDVLTLVPSWRFFGPRPSIVDLHLLMRDRLSDGSLTPFEVVDLPFQSRRMWWVWNPDRRARKVVFDAVGVLEGLARHLSSRETIVTSVPYLLLLNFLLGLEHPPTASETQFLIVRTWEFGRGDPRLVMRSRFHRLG